MSFCPNCGAKLEADVHFCSSCGFAKQNSVSDIRKNRIVSGGKRLHCPECKSGDISPIVETEITGGTSFNHSFSKRNSMSAIQFNNTHRNYWMCSSCGCKFRNLQNLEEEIRNTENLVKRGITGIVLMAILILLFTATIGFSFFCGLCIFVIVMVFTAIIILKNRIIRLDEEREYLKKRCFD